MIGVVELALLPAVES